MSARAAAWLGWSLCGLSVVLMTAAGLLTYVSYSVQSASESAGVGAMFGLALLAYPVVGALIVSRRPENSVGWMFCVIGIFGAVHAASREYATYAILAPSDPLSMTAVVAVIVRFHYARGSERQQLKWFVYAVVAMVAIFTTSVVAAELLRKEPIDIAYVPTIASMVALPVAAGIAILRYRLYDIDVIINRTLVYGALTVALAAVYFGGVVSLQALFRTLTGQESQLAVVATTLAIAALFNPLRRRVQGFIDRRFYRKKYDAAKTLEAFGARLRDETDLNALKEDLVEVVRDTIQPEHASLWLKPAHRSESHGRAEEAPR